MTTPANHPAPDTPGTRMPDADTPGTDAPPGDGSATSEPTGDRSGTGEVAGDRPRTGDLGVGGAVAGGPVAAGCEGLVVVDMQAAFVSGADAVPGAGRLLERVTELLERARAAGAVVVHLQNDGPPGADDEPGTPGWELYLPVKPGPREHVIRKPRDDGFYATQLGDVLVSAGVRSLAICGVMSEMCVAATARTALDRGYHVALPFDAHGTYDVPAVAGVAEEVPAHVVSRVAAWALGDQPDNTSPASAITFTH